MIMLYLCGGRLFIIFCNCIIDLWVNFLAIKNDSYFFISGSTFWVPKQTKGVIISKNSTIQLGCWADEVYSCATCDGGDHIWVVLKLNICNASRISISLPLWLKTPVCKNLVQFQLANPWGASDKMDGEVCGIFFLFTSSYPLLIVNFLN